MMAQETVGSPDRRETRITMRVAPNDKALIERAAEARSLSVTDYMITIARADAERTLVERCVFTLDDDAFRRFNEILDRPVQDKPRLKAMLERNKRSKWTINKE
ncbi:MAG: DUF1778 domain-containing protein [Rhodospirillaceae bacterium]